MLAQVYYTSFGLNRDGWGEVECYLQRQGASRLERQVSQFIEELGFAVSGLFERDNPDSVDINDGDCLADFFSDCSRLPYSLPLPDGFDAVARAAAKACGAYVRRGDTGTAELPADAFEVEEAAQRIAAAWAPADAIWMGVEAAEFVARVDHNAACRAGAAARQAKARRKLSRKWLAEARAAHAPADGVAKWRSNEQAALESVESTTRNALPIIRKARRAHRVARASAQALADIQLAADAARASPAFALRIAEANAAFAASIAKGKNISAKAATARAAKAHDFSSPERGALEAEANNMRQAAIEANDRARGLSRIARDAAAINHRERVAAKRRLDDAVYSSRIWGRVAAPRV